jgi:tRNA A37 threonylcarbamoyladenosine dehydratase
MMEETTFQRTELLLGKEKMNRLSEQRVILFGVGGVGSWCAEGLVRSGIHHLTIVDFDVVNITNINRQLVATTTTLGRPKVEVLRERLLDINPDIEVVAIQERFTAVSAPSFHLDRYDYVIDAIDSVKDKARLILMASQTKAVLFSSMGAALKMDSSRIKVDEFWKVHGDPLARALRHRFKHQQEWPDKKFMCVFSDERLENAVETTEEERVNGTVAHITAIFGFTLAGLVIRSCSKI